jgi:hypothetical protein
MWSCATACQRSLWCGEIAAVLYRWAVQNMELCMPMMLELRWLRSPSCVQEAPMTHTMWLLPMVDQRRHVTHVCQLAEQYAALEAMVVGGAD